MRRLIIAALILAVGVLAADLATAQNRGAAPTGKGLAAGAPGRQMGPGGPGGGPGEGLGGPERGGPGPAVQVQTGEVGVFVLSHGLLLKYDALTLEKLGELQVLTQPKQTVADQGNRPKPPPCPSLLLAGTKLLIVTGGEFISVDAVTLQVLVQSALPAMPEPPEPPEGIEPPQGAGDRRPRPPSAGPCVGKLSVAGDVLYVLRGQQIIGINIDDGNVVGIADLPRPPLPEEE